jgi:prolyl-tRNA synthetase
MKTAESIYQQLTEAGVDVILDDRDERPGVKFKDSELIGFPIRIGIGDRSLAEGEVEIKPRKGEMFKVRAGEAVSSVLDWIKTAP